MRQSFVFAFKTFSRCSHPEGPPKCFSFRSDTAMANRWQAFQLSAKSINLSVYKLSYNLNKLNVLLKQVWLTIQSIRLFLVQD